MKTWPALLWAIAIFSCAGVQRPQPEQPAELSLPAQLAGKAVVVAETDPEYTRADVAGAEKAAGEGGVSEAIAIRVLADIVVWRMWSGPDKKDANGNTNRLGAWWAYDAPRGSRAEYRAHYEICKSWNDLTWMATCTLKAGAVVAIGPGNSVSAQVCGDTTGTESYAANARDWQVYVAKPWTRTAELECPPETNDYAADCADIAQPARPDSTCSDP